MDIAFAPGEVDDEGNVHLDDTSKLERTLFSRFPAGVEIRPSIQSLRAFIEGAPTNPDFEIPADDVILGVHANEQGQLFIAMYDGQKGYTSFDTLKSTLLPTNASTQSVNIDAILNDPPTSIVHVKGCNIGRVTKFLLKFKAALGGNVALIAPKHIYVVTEEIAGGSLECLQQQFIVASPKRLSRADAISVFQGQKNTFFDGTPIPSSMWGQWISAASKKKNKKVPRIRLGMPVGANNQTTIAIPTKYVVDERFPHQDDFIPPTFDPNQLLANWTANVKSSPEFTTDEFPWWERYGYADVNAFIAGFDWTFGLLPDKKNPTQVHATGRRALHMLRVPIVDPATNTLLFNFYPTSGTGTPVKLLHETDQKLFTQV